MNLRKGFLGTVPRRSLFIFLLGVFLLFGTFGLASDMSELGRQPVFRLVLSVLLTSTFSIGYATAGFLLRGKSWKVIVPLFIVHFLAMGAMAHWLPSSPRPTHMEMADIGRVESRLSSEALGIIVATFLGYSCFVYASITEGRRYFRAHAEIALAQEIHHVLVPAIDEKMGGYEFYGQSSASGEVGGDLIDLAATGESWVAYVADVSGHGVAPGLVMGMTKSASRMLLSSGDDSVHLMPRLNEVLYPLKKPDMFITFCFVGFSGGRLRVGLAGHPAILQYSARTAEVTELESPNMPLGILPSTEFSTSEMIPEARSVFALYTDGLLEAANAAGEEFGIKRLKEVLQKHGKEPLDAICRAVQESVARHGAQADDQSIFLIRKL